MKLSNRACKASRGSEIQKKLYSKSNNADVGLYLTAYHLLVRLKKY